jgi:hypothetical protein
MANLPIYFSDLQESVIKGCEITKLSPFSIIIEYQTIEFEKSGLIREYYLNDEDLLEIWNYTYFVFSESGKFWSRKYEWFFLKMISFSFGLSFDLEKDDEDRDINSDNQKTTSAEPFGLQKLFELIESKIPTKKDMSTYCPKTIENPLKSDDIPNEEFTEIMDFISWFNIILDQNDENEILQDIKKL